MFNERKLTTSHGFVKAYSNNWLSQLGAVYKYESPKDVLRKPNYQHRKIALYSILAMAFVAFFTLFMIVHEAERKSRQLVIESSFSNETAIEPSAGSQDTILTTPFSSGVPVGNGTAFLPSPSGMDGNGAESRAVVMESREPAVKRTRRLRYYGDVVERVASYRAPVGRDRLVLLPARFLKPPPPDSLREGNAGRKWSSKNEEPFLVREEAERRRDGGTPSHPNPFHIAPNGPLPVGFQQPQQEQPDSDVQSRANRSLESLAADLGPFSIQDIIRQLTLAKRKQQQQFYYNYPYRPSPQPSEFNHPVHQNHRVKFTGIYRHPRKNGDITTVFGAASQRPQEVHVQAPQLINQQLGTVGTSTLMPDRLYNFKPQNPSEVNLLATEQFRFAPQKESTEDSWASRWPKEGMPFSVMLNLEPMGSIGGRPSVYQQQQQQPLQQQQRYKKRYRNPQRPLPYRQAWGGSGGNHGEQHFAQLSPYHHRSRPQNNLYRDAFGQAGGDDYEGENYFRKEGRVQPRIPAYASPLIGPGRLMVHFNIFPRQQPPAARRNSGLESDETRFQPSSGSVELNTGEKRTGKELIFDISTSTVPPEEELTAPAQWNLQGRTEGQWNPIPTHPTFNWTSTFPTEPTLTKITVQQPDSTVEVIKSIEIPTQINFDHVPLGRNPPPPLPSFNRWTGDEATIKLWSTHNNIKRA